MHVCACALCTRVPARSCFVKVSFVFCRTYAAESTLSGAAVHAGVLANGEAGFVLLVYRGYNQNLNGSFAGNLQSATKFGETLSFSLMAVANGVCTAVCDPLLCVPMQTCVCILCIPAEVHRVEAHKPQKLRRPK